MSLTVQPNCLKGWAVWRHALKRSPRINRMSRALYPGFLSSATWPSMTKKHYNVLIIN